MIYLTSSNKALLQKIAQLVDVGEGYDASVRKPGNVTERYANIDVHPNGNQYALIFDDTVWKNRQAILDELAKYGVPRATIAAKAQRIKDAVSTGETVTFTSGPLAGVTLNWAQKGSDWTPPPTGV